MRANPQSTGDAAEEGWRNRTQQKHTAAPRASQRATAHVHTKMECFKDGSIMWSRSGPRDKFWPSIVFRTWDAAKQAGFVPDGIAFLIEAGRKVDVTDAEAAPREGELLNL